MVSPLTAQGRWGLSAEDHRPYEPAEREAMLEATRRSRPGNNEGDTPMMYGGDGWMWNDGWGWGGWILMTLVMVVFWSLVITAIVLAIRYLTGGSHPNQASPSSARAAEDVLAERFARGEIDDDEYRQRMTTLREHR